MTKGVSSTLRRVAAFAGATVMVSTLCLSVGAGATGDAVISRYLITNPLANGVAIADNVLQPLITSGENAADADLGGSGYAKIAVAGWVDQGTQLEVVSELAAFTVPVPSESLGLSSAVVDACPAPAGVTQTTTSVALIPGSVEVSCIDSGSGLPKTVIGWISSNVLAFLFTVNLSPSQAEAVAVSQSTLIPTSGIDLAAKTRYTIARFALNSSALDPLQKLQIYRDAVALSAMTPTAVRFVGHQSVKGPAGPARQLAVSRVRAVYKYLVAQLKSLGFTPTTLQGIGLGSGQPVISTIQRGSPSSSLAVNVDVAYLG